MPVWRFMHALICFCVCAYMYAPVSTHAGCLSACVSVCKHKCLCKCMDVGCVCMLYKGHISSTLQWAIQKGLCATVGHRSSRSNEERKAAIFSRSRSAHDTKFPSLDRTRCCTALYCTFLCSSSKTNCSNNLFALHHSQTRQQGIIF